MTGGGFGLFGDFVNASSNRFGGGVADTVLGPGWSFLSDTAGLVTGLPIQAATGQKVNPGREAINYAGRYTPVVASNWATRGRSGGCSSTSCNG